MKCWRMSRITKNPGDYEIYRHRPDSSSGIYTTFFMEDEFGVVSANQRNQD